MAYSDNQEKLKDDILFSVSGENPQDIIHALEWALDVAKEAKIKYDQAMGH